VIHPTWGRVYRDRILNHHTYYIPHDNIPPHGQDLHSRHKYSHLKSSYSHPHNTSHRQSVHTSSHQRHSQRRQTFQYRYTILDHIVNRSMLEGSELSSMYIVHPIRMSDRRYIPVLHHKTKSQHLDLSRWDHNPLES